MRITALSSSPSVTGKREFDEAADSIESLGLACAGDSRVEVILVGRRRMAALNRKYKGRRGAAEILTFVYDDDPSPEGEDPAGEILICWERLASSAAAVGVPPGVYLLRLVAHGLAHIEGFTHSGDEEAERMERRELEILGGTVSRVELSRMFGDGAGRYVRSG